MWQRAEDELRLAKGSVVVAHIGQLATADPHGRPSLLVRCSEHEREPGVAFDQCTELAPSVAAGAEHTNWNLVHA